MSDSQNSGKLDLNALRLSQDYGATLGVKKILMTVPVGRPGKEKFFRVHPSDTMVFPAMLLSTQDVKETYLVSPTVAGILDKLVRPVELYAAIDRQNNPMLIPVPLPAPNGTRNPWHQSLLAAIDRSRRKWLRVAANQSVGAYDVYEATGVLPDPEWPTSDIEELINIGFRGHVLTDVDHPMVQQLLGRV